EEVHPIRLVLVPEPEEGGLEAPIDSIEARRGADILAPLCGGIPQEALPGARVTGRVEPHLRPRHPAQAGEGLTGEVLPEPRDIPIGPLNKVLDPRGPLPRDGRLALEPR